LPVQCIPGARYNLSARKAAIQRVADGVAVEQAAPDCQNPDRSADASTLRRWCWRRIQSLPFVIYRVATLFAWDWRAAARMLIPEPNPL